MEMQYPEAVAAFSAALAIAGLAMRWTGDWWLVALIKLALFTAAIANGLNAASSFW